MENKDLLDNGLELVDNPSIEWSRPAVAAQSSATMAIWLRLAMFTGTFLLLGVLLSAGALIRNNLQRSAKGPATPQDAVPLNLQGGEAVDENYTIYGRLKVGNSVVLAPSVEPQNAVQGELYFSSQDSRLRYFDGSQFILLGEPNAELATTLNGVGGAITLGNNLVLENGVLSAVTPQPVFQNQDQITAVRSLRSGSADLMISKDGNNNLTISLTGSGSGGGVALAPETAQSDLSTNPSIFIHKTGSGNLIQFTTGLTPVNRFVVNNNGAITSGSISFAQVTNKPLFVNTINGLYGDVLLGEGFDNVNNTIINTGVLSVATATGHLSLGTGLEISGRTIYNTGVIKLFGTINQVAVSAQTGEITLSLPQDIATTSSPIFANLTLATALGVGNGGTGRSTLAANGVLMGNGTAPISAVTALGSGQCFMSTAGAPAFGTCPGSGAVQSLNGLGGDIILSGTSAGSVTTSGSTITIADASYTAKGLAEFNSTNFTVASGVVNTVQNIRVTDAPTFAGLTLTNALGVGNGGTGLNTTPLNGQLLIGNGSGYSLANLTAGLGIQITNSAGGITIAAPFAGTCDQCANNSLSNLSSVAINTSLLPGTAGAIDIGSGTLPIRDLFMAGSSVSPGLNNFKITGIATAARTITLPDLSGNVAIVQGASSVAQTGNISVSGALYSGSLSVSGSGSVGGTLTAGAVSVDGNASVSGEVQTNTITPNGANTLMIGVNSQALILQGSSTTISATNGPNKVSLTFVPPTANITYRLQNAAAGTYDICTTAGNCVGTGGSLDSPGGTAGALAKFSDANTLVDSLLNESGTIVTVNGTLAVNTITNTAAGITNTLQFATPGTSNKAITLPNLSGTVCLDVNNCNSVSLQSTSPGTAQSGSINVSGNIFAGGTFNRLSLTANTDGFSVSGGTNAGRTLTITGGDLNVSGASFINQDVRVSASPTFAGLTLTAPLSVANGGTGLSNTPTNGQLLIGNGTGFSLSTITAGAGVQITNGAGSITIAVPNSGSCNSCATTALSNLVNVAINTSLLPAPATNVDIGSSTLSFQNGYFANTLYTRYVSPNGATPLTVGVVGQDLTLQGATTKLTSTSGSQTATLTFEAPTANYTYRLLNAGATGIYDICTSAGNCSGAGGNYVQNTTTMQTANFTIQSAAAANVGGTIRGATSQTADLLQLQNSAGVTLVGITADGKLVFGNGTNTASFQRGTLTANRTYTLPDADGTLCLTSGNCAGAGGGITGSGTASYVAKFTAAGAIGNSLLFDDGTNIGIGTAVPSAKLSVNEKLRMFDATPTGALVSTDVGYLFGATIPSGMFTEVSGEVLSYGINVPQVGTRDTTRVGGLFRLDTRGTNQEFVVNGFPTGGSVATNRLAVNLQNGNASVAVNGGNLGVGIASAAYKLDVSAGTGIVAQFSGRVIGGNAVNANEFTTLSQLNTATSNNNNYFIQGGNGYGATATLGTNDANALNFETNNVTRMTILAGGNVGIGTAAPAVPLHIVYPFSKTDTTLRQITEWSSNDATNRWGLKVSATGAASQANRVFILQTHESELTNSGNLSLQGLGGNVGIGNTNPGSLLDISGALSVRGMAAPSASPLSQGRIYFDSTANKFKVSENGGSFVDLISAATAATLQGAYTASTGGTTPEFKLDSTRGGLDIQDADTTIGANLLTVRKSSASGLGAVAFSVTNNGNIAANSDATTGTAATIIANTLTTGTGLNVSSSSASATTANLIQGSQAATYTTAIDVAGNLLRLNRSLTANVSGGSSITFDASSSYSADSLRSYSWSHTVGSGSNRILIVGISEGNCTSCGTVSVTYGGVAMTATQVSTAASGSRSHIFTLVNPPIGTASVAVSLTGTGYSVGGAMSWFGVDQSSPVRATARAGGSSTTPSVTVASEVNDITVGIFGSSGMGASTLTANNGQTVYWSQADSGSGGAHGSGTSKPGAATSTTLGYTISDIKTWDMSALTLRTAAAASMAISGSVASLSSNCSVTAGDCSDTSNILSLNQQYASSTGAVLNVLNAGTGNLAVFDASNASANGVSIDVQNAISSQYALRVTTNNGSINALYVRADGNVGIGNAAPNEKLHVSGNVRARSFITDVSADLAENYPAGEDLAAGEVVSFGLDGKLYRATSQSSVLAGVISTEPGMRLAGGTEGAPLALAGRVPVVVSDENGAIVAGDYLTASSRPGVAMKATGKGMVIGVALESLKGSKGTVMLFANLHYYDPASGTALQGSDSTFTNLNVSGLATIGTLDVTGNATIKGNLALEGHLIGNHDTRGQVTVSAGSTVVELLFKKAYTSAPYVVVSPVNTFAPAYRVEATAQGFKLYLREAYTQDIVFSYQVQQ